MINFHDLLKACNGIAVGELQESARKAFPLLVKQSRFTLWSPGQPSYHHGPRLLIGVATYSEPDLRLLDLLGEVLDRRTESPLHIDVFNILDGRCQQDFDKYIPGIGNVFQTPVVGFWQNGVLKDNAWGKSARDFIARVCNVEPSSLHRLWS
jgi:hypothetical protein